MSFDSASLSRCLYFPEKARVMICPSCTRSHGPRIGTEIERKKRSVPRRPASGVEHVILRFYARKLLKRMQPFSLCLELQISIADFFPSIANTRRRSVKRKRRRKRLGISQRAMWQVFSCLGGFRVPKSWAFCRRRENEKGPRPGGGPGTAKRGRKVV